jgi:hypothetical protein
LNKSKEHRKNQSRASAMHKLLRASLLVFALTAPAQMTVAQAPMPIEPAQASYVTSAQVDVMKLLPPPPGIAVG